MPPIGWLVTVGFRHRACVSAPSTPRKGLNSPPVILCAADQMPNGNNDELGEANLLYVGLTRAMNHLAVTWTGRMHSRSALRSRGGPKCILRFDASWETSRPYRFVASIGWKTF